MIIRTLLTIFFISIFMIKMEGQASDIYDTTRIYKVMDKARSGEPVTIGVIGGSITAGFAASEESKRWANKMCTWWKTTFPKSDIKFINAGLGGTGTAIADFRVDDELLKFNPDFVIIEFGVNDSLDSLSSETLEGLVRKILKSSQKPGVMILNLMLENGTSAVKYHRPVADYYKIPYVNYAALIEPKLKKDGKTLHDIYVDGTHPNDVGMHYIASFVINELNMIYYKLPAKASIPQINSKLPVPLVSDVYEHTVKYNPSTIVPVSNEGWKSSKGWNSGEPGAELVFKISGKAIGILYNLHNNSSWGKAEVWVDNGPHKIIDAYWKETWGPAIVFKEIADDLSDKEHELHIKIRSDYSNPTGDHYFPLLNVLSAGK